jgi:hypothetical protein
VLGVSISIDSNPEVCLLLPDKLFESKVLDFDVEGSEPEVCLLLLDKLFQSNVLDFDVEGAQEGSNHFLDVDETGEDEIFVISEKIELSPDMFRLEIRVFKWYLIFTCFESRV